MPEWDPDVVVDEKLVHSLLGEQFPELDASSARLLGEGWDNSVWVVAELWAFRFPHRAIALPGVERELAVLPSLAPQLPAPIPLPTFVGRPTERFARPFFGAPLLRGVEPAEAALTDEDRDALGADLGRFLRALHDVELDADLPVDPIRRADMPFRVTRTRQRIVEHSGLWEAPPRVEGILAAAEALPPSTDVVVTHGDLHLRHVLVERGTLSGVIDWGDVCRSDPAIDLMVAWMLLPPSARERFEAEYGRISEQQLLRSRVLALFLCLTLLGYAHDVGHTSLRQECVAGLERTLVDWS